MPEDDNQLAAEAEPGATTSYFEANLTAARQRIRAVEDEFAHVRDAVSGELEHVRHAVQGELQQVKKAVYGELSHVRDELLVMKRAVENEMVVVEGAVRKELSFIIGRIEEAPAFMRFNKFIHGGYRLQVQNYTECIHSLFSVHNETVNIWSHLIGFGLMIGIFIYTMRNLNFMDKSDIFFFAFYFLSAAGMFLTSSCYHLFNCHSDQLCRNLLTCDYVGIFSMILGSTLSAMQISFYCLEAHRTFYQMLYLTVCGSGIVMVTVPWMNDEKYERLRQCFFIVTVVSAVLPLGHLTYLHGAAVSFYWWMLLVFYGAGVLVYLAKFPESFFPGRFDIFLASHQLWHFFVLAAGLWHAYSLITLYNTECH